MKTSTALILGGIGLGAFFLTRKMSSGTGPKTSVGGAPLTADPGQVAVVGNAFDPGEADWFLAFGMKADVCDLPDSRRDAWTPAQLACAGKYHRDRAYAFYRQVWLPASKIPITSLTADDFVLAIRFLSNQLNRKGCPWTYGQSKSVNDFNDDGAIQFGNWVVKYGVPIVSALTFGLYSLADKAVLAVENAASDDIAAIPGNTSVDKYNNAMAAFHDALIALPNATDAGENDLPFEQTPDPSDYAGQATFDIALQSIDSPFINSFGPCLDFGFDPIVFDFGQVFYGCRLFRSVNGAATWEKPWVCTEMGYVSDGGDGSTVTDKLAKADIIYKHARLFRTLDILRATLKPGYRVMIGGATPDADGNINVADLNTYKIPVAGTYAYKVGAAELWGCALPATPVDNAYDLNEARQAAKTNIQSDYVNPNTPTAKTVAQSTLPPPVALPPSQQIASTYSPAPVAGASAPATLGITKQTRR